MYYIFGIFGLSQFTMKYNEYGEEYNFKIYANVK